MDWRQSIRENTKRTVWVLISFVLLYTLLGLVIDWFFWAERALDELSALKDMAHLSAVEDEKTELSEIKATADAVKCEVEAEKERKAQQAATRATRAAAREKASTGRLN